MPPSAAATSWEDEGGTPAILSRILLPGLLLAAVTLLGITPIADGDLWWHLANGEFFLQNRVFPDRDPFSFTAAPSGWVIREWLAQVWFAAVYRLGGPALLTLVKAVLFTVSIGLLWRLGIALRCPVPTTTLVLLLATLVARPRILVRPEVLSFVVLAAALSILLREWPAAPAAGARSRPLWKPYLLVPLQILWANVHSSFLLGLLQPWVFIIDEATLRLRRSGPRGDGARSGRLWHLAFAAILLWPASALTPQGIHGLLYPLYLLRFPTVAQVDEVRGLVTALRVCSACLEAGTAFLVLALGTLALCAVQARRSGAVGPGTWMLLLGAAGAPFAVYRLLPYSALILAALALRGLGWLAEVRRDAPLTGSRRGRWRGLAPYLAALFLTVTAAQAVWAPRFGFGLGVAPEVFPEGAARFIEGSGARGPLFNNFEFGSYLLWSLFPRYQVFIHPDVWHSVSDDRFIARFLRSARDPATFDALAREYGIELLVLPSAGPAWAFVAADPRWALLYWDQVASVYARRGGANAALIAARELRLTRYAPDLSYLLPLAQDPARLPAAAAELRRLVAEDPANQAARLSLAFLLKAAGQNLPEALAQVETVQRAGLQDATLLTWQAELLARLGRPAEAEAAARAALRLSPTARAARLVLADLRAQAGDRAEAIRLLRALLALPDLAPEQRREAEGRLDALQRPP